MVMLPPLSITASRGCDVSAFRNGNIAERVVYDRLDVSREEKSREDIENWFLEEGRKTYAILSFCGD
jgi:hypothetical protein